jgi:hypothetical protein
LKQVLITRLPLDVISAFASTHFPLSELLAGEAQTLGFVKERAMLLAFAVHPNHESRSPLDSLF